jgi:hypothetical protein
MTSFVLELFLMFFMLALGLYLVGYTLSNLIAFIMGAPFVATKQKEIDLILNEIPMKKDSFLIELGSGDGRFIRSAVKKYNVRGLGIEIQPFLLWYSRIVSYVQRVPKAKYKSQNFFHTDLSQADVIFMFLLPKTIKKLTPKLQKETREGVIIISHAFQITGLEKYLTSTLKRKPYSTFFYTLK